LVRRRTADDRFGPAGEKYEAVAEGAETTEKDTDDGDDSLLDTDHETPPEVRKPAVSEPLSPR
jgi:hypothetical protein